LSSAVPHSTAFLPPAFIAMLPPMQLGLGRGGVDREDEARALGRVGHALGDDAGFGPDGRDLALQARRRTISTSVIASSFSVLMTALFQVSGIAPPV
jgi:hypothetical protein